MPQTHLVLVGTSVLRNLPRAAGGGGDPCIDAVARCGNPRQPDRSSCTRILDNRECFNKLYEILKDSPYDMSAELNAMKWIVNGGCRDVAEIILYPTDTPEALLAARLLEAWLRENCPAASVSTRRLGSPTQEFWPMILDVVKKVADDAAKAYREGRMVYLNATGGFKPEAAAALLAAAAAAPVTPYYIHEAMREPVMLPYIPLTFDKGRARVITGLLRSLAREPPQEPVCASDPRYEQVAWLILFLSRGGGCIRVDQRTAEIFDTIASIYEAMIEAAP